MEILFITTILSVLFAYFGYPLTLVGLSKVRRRQVMTADITPSLTVIIAAYNEETKIDAKLENTLLMEYPRDMRQIIVVSDGSTDGTNDIVRRYAKRGVELVETDGRVGKDISGFREKPKINVKTIPGAPGHVLASMGIYLFETDTLMDILKSQEGDDFGRDIIPKLLHSHRVYAYPYGQSNCIEDYINVTLEDGTREFQMVSPTRDSGYWRDVGNLDAYWNANMDLTGVDPYFSLYGTRWPIHTNQIQAPPAKFVFATERPEGFRVGKALDSLVGPGCIVSGIIRNSVLSYNVVVRSWAMVDESVISDGVVIGRHCKIKKAIIDKKNVIPPHTEIGYKPEEDRKRFTMTPRGIVVVPKGYFWDS